MMRLVQAGCMTTPSDVPRSQTEIGTKYVAANSLIYLNMARSVRAPSTHPPLFEKNRAEQRREEHNSKSTGSGNARNSMYAINGRPGRQFDRSTREVRPCVCVRACAFVCLHRLSVCG